MPFLPFASFIIWDNESAYALQSAAIILILSATLIHASIKQKELKIPITSLPYIILPIILFASTNGKLELASNDRLQCLSMLIAAILIFTQKESRWLQRSMLACANIHLLIQIHGIKTGDAKTAITSLFPLANEIAFFYLMAAFTAIIAFSKEKGFWKKYAAIIGALSLASIILGDPSTIGRISSEDAAGIWLGLACGTAFTIALFLCKKLNLPQTPILSFSALIFLALPLAPLIAIHVIPRNAMGEALTRLVNWQAAWSLVRENPLGVGFGAYGANIMQHWPTLEEAYYVWPKTVFSAAHNQYLQILTETGWPGLLYYSALLAAPWLIAIRRYLKAGEPRFLLMAGSLATVLSVMEVSEAMSMFAFIQITHWCFLLYCAKAALPPARKSLRLRSPWLLPLIPLIACLLFDRGRQLYSIHLTDDLARGKVPFAAYKERRAEFDRALEIHRGNKYALWFRANMLAMSGESEKALEALDEIEEMFGYMMPVDNVRMVVYFRKGDRRKACETGDFVFRRFTDDWTLELKGECTE